MGRKHTESSKYKISERLVGRIPWNRGKTKYDSPCLICGITLGKDSKFCCSVDCYRVLHFRKRVESWKSGKKVDSRFLRKYLLSIRGWECWDCGTKEWMNFPVPLDLEHMDGNSDNNSEENLKLLCLNCHGLTKTYKAKNKGKGRHLRRTRYREGKSF